MSYKRFTKNAYFFKFYFKSLNENKGAEGLASMAYGAYELGAFYAQCYIGENLIQEVGKLCLYVVAKTIITNLKLHRFGNISEQ